MSIVLIGYRGSGKTTLGKLLARQLGRLFVDSDEQIIARAGRDIARIFATIGEPGFRDLESQVIADLARHEDHVIALGGGALGREQNRTALAARKHELVYLRCEAVELHRRIVADVATAQSRPPLTALGGSLDEIRLLLAQREAIWRTALTHEIDVTHKTPEQAAAEIRTLLAIR